jgi:sugar phosphate isomerase/epimerase
VHDNDGSRNGHLVPYAGTIDWAAAMMETQKVGYDGMLMFEVADNGDAMAALRRCADARERLESTFVIF